MLVLSVAQRKWVLWSVHLAGGGLGRVRNTHDSAEGLAGVFCTSFRLEPAAQSPDDQSLHPDVVGPVGALEGAQQRLPAEICTDRFSTDDAEPGAQVGE